MVGVGGRSKGCVTCRQRRVKCDETHPECHRCIKANRTCGGYQQNNFVDGLPSKIRRKARAAAVAAPPPEPGPSTQDVALVVRTTPPRSTSGSPRASSALPMDVEDIVSMSELWPADVELPAWRDPSMTFEWISDLQGSDAGPDFFGPIGPSLDLSPFKEEMFVAFTREYMLRGTAPIDFGSSKELTLPGGELSRECLITISTAYFGRRHYQPEIINLGLQRYGKVLSELNPALAHPTHSKSPMVLTAVSILTLFEGWISHALGLERLFAYRGAALHKDPRCLGLYEEFRVTIILACLASEKACLLATEEWCTVPWSLNPARKSALQKLLDILGKLPPLLGSTTAYCATENPTAIDHTLGREILAQFRSKLDDLDRWWVEFEAQHGDDFWEVPRRVRTIDAATQPTSWQTNYMFRKLYLAECFIDYYSTRIICLGHSRRILSRDGGASPPRMAAMGAELRACAIEICRAVDYHLNRERCGIGSLNLGFPLRMVWVAIGGDTPEGNWLREIVELIASGILGSGWAGLPWIVFGHDKA